MIASEAARSARARHLLADDDGLPPPPPAAPPPAAPQGLSDVQRAKIFITAQMCFLLLTPFCGGFHYSVWSMLDSALLIQSLGITVLAFTLDEDWLRALALKVAVLTYLAALGAMGFAVMISGVVGWKAMF